MRFHRVPVWLWVAACADREPESPERPSVAALAKGDIPIGAAVGHGAVFDAYGKELVVDLDLILATQAHLLVTLSELAPADPTVAAQLELVDKVVEDDVVAQALMIDVLIAAGANPQPAYEHLNGALRTIYVGDILQQEVAGDWTDGVPLDVLELLELEDFALFSVIGTSGADYVATCRAAGVPIPDTVLGQEWLALGEFTEEFILGWKRAELYAWTSADPAGLCLALPRSEGEWAKTFGVICQGKESSNVCFFDNPPGARFARNTPAPISAFIGGEALLGKPGGVCTDCHAGENPWISHPEQNGFEDVLSPWLPSDPPDVSADLRLPAVQANWMPDDWYRPLVSAGWTQNRGPTYLLDPVSSPQRCDGCHADPGSGGSAGRFPEMSLGETPSYCNVVLEKAIGYPEMPPYGGDWWAHRPHIDALWARCDEPAIPPGGTAVVPVPADDPGFVSAPWLVDPLYACANKIGVRGVIDGATVTVSIGGGLPIAPDPGGTPALHEFTVPGTLSVGQSIVATVTLGAASASAEVFVEDIGIAHPSGQLPPPVFDPATVHACGSSFAVGHVPGATLIVTRGGVPATGVPSAGSTGYSGWWDTSGFPFSVEDVITVKQECGGFVSETVSMPVVYGPVVGAPRFDPPETYQGQRYVNQRLIVPGAVVTTSIAAGGPLGSPLSWPTAAWGPVDLATPLGRAFAIGDVFEVEQALCAGPGPRGTTTPTLPCSALPAPRFAPLWAGQQEIAIESAVPGARIRIWTGTEEIGDGAGGAIRLRRALVESEQVYAVQQTDSCTSSRAFTNRVLRP